MTVLRSIPRALACLAVVTLALVAAACAPSAPRPLHVVGRAVFASANGVRVRAVYRDNDTVALKFSGGRVLSLDRARSGSGARYTRGKAEWWEHQGHASFRDNGKLLFSGTIEKKPPVLPIDADPRNNLKPIGH